ncbi:MAG: AAA family ATPase [Bryobacteraceae bacterium]
MDTKPRWISGKELAAMKPASRDALIENLLPEQGLILLSADPKAGKSTFALELCRAICTGEPALEHFQPKQGAALYWMADDTAQARFVRNYQEVFAGVEDSPFESLLARMPLCGEGALELRSAIARSGAKLAVIDCLTSIRSEREQDFVRQEYEEMRLLADLAAEQSCCILLLHHKATGKRNNGDNPFRLTAGSFAASTGPDGLMVLDWLKATRPERFVTFVSRDLDPLSFLYARDPQTRRLFYIGGEGWDEHWDDALRAYRAERTGTLDSAVLATILDATERTARSRLAVWRTAGLVEETGRHSYVWSNQFMAAAERLIGGAQ